MITFHRLLLGAALLLQASPLRGQEAQPEPIFRYISIEPYGRIDLGGAFPQASALGAPIGPNLFRLVGPGGRPVQFADTEAILVELTEARLVRAFYFLYLDASKAFAEREAEYITTLGAPERFAYDSAQAHIVRSTWRDLQTEFEMLQVTTPSGVRVLSALRDRRPLPPARPQL